MTAPSVIYILPEFAEKEFGQLPGSPYDDRLFARYIRADAPELVALVEALQWIALGPGYNETPADAVLSNMRQAAAALEAWEKMK